MALALTKAGVVRNPNSHANRTGRGSDSRPDGVLLAQPTTAEAVAGELQRFADAGVGLIVVDGGDGTLREVLSALPQTYGETPPVLAVLASGKTNILALDLGAGPGWTLEAALNRAAEPEPAMKTREPIEVSWSGCDQPPIRGFVFGLGAFVKATQMSQNVHRMGAYHNLSVALTLAGAAVGALFGGARDQWRQGVSVQASLDEEAPARGERFLLMATTLKRLPFGLQPFGPPREGMKVLDVDAPPKRLHAAIPAVLRGSQAPWLAKNGYRRREAELVSLSLEQPVVIDGEIYPGGEIKVRKGAPMRFLAP